MVALQLADFVALGNDIESGFLLMVHAGLVHFLRSHGVSVFAYVGGWSSGACVFSSLV